MEPEWPWMKGFVKLMSFKSGIKGRGSDRWWERRWGMGIVVKWCMQGNVNQEESEQDEVDRTMKGADSQVRSVGDF